MKKSHISWPHLLALTLCLVLGAGCTNAAKARRVLATADSDFKAQKFDMAEAEYISVLRLSYTNAVAIRQLGFIYFEEGRQTAAYQYLKKAYEQENTNAQIQLKLAELYGVGGEPKDALDLLRLVLQRDPANEHALLLLAQLVQTNDLASLRQQLETQLREGGQGAAGCHSALGWVDLRMQRVNEAEKEFQTASTLDPKLPSPHLGMAAIYSFHKDLKGVQQALKTAAELSPVRSAARLKYVEFEMQSGAQEEANQILLDITRQAPDYIPAELYLMRLAFATHKYEDCKAAIARILARDNSPPNFEASFQLGTLALAQRDVTNALRTFQHLDESYRLYSRKPMPEVKCDLALTYLMNNEKMKAVQSLNEALAADPGHAQATLLLAELDYRGEQYTEAITLLSQLIGKMEKLFEKHPEEIERHPQYAQAQLALAETFLAQKRPDRALQVFQRMAELFTRNAEIPRRMGLIYKQAGDAAKARAAYEKSLELAPDYLATLQNITALDIVERRFDQAHHRLAGVMERNPKSAEPLLLQARIYSAEGQTNQAESAYSKAIELDPQMPEAYMDLAQFYLVSQQEQQALDRLTALVAKTNDLSAMQLIGEIHEAGRRYEKAGDMYEKVLAINPHFVPALNNLAYVDSEFLTNMDKALQLAETAMDLRYNDPHAADTLGWILFKKHEYAKALSLIREGAEKQPNDPEVQMHLGMAYYMMGEEKPARKSLEQALSAEGDFPGKELARRRLDVLEIDPAKATPAVVKQLQDLVQKDPQDPVPLNRLAAIQEQRGDFPKAAESLQKLIALNHENWPAMMRLARLYADHFNDLRKGRDLAKSAHDLAPPDEPEPSALLGELVYRSEDYPWSLSLLQQAANHSPDQPSVYYWLALAYYAAGQVTDADAAMLKAVQSGESLPNLAQARQFQVLRAAVKEPAKAQASSELAQQILKKEPNNVPALMVSALLAERRGATNEAGQIWRKVLSIYPPFAPAMRELAMLYSHSQNADDLKKAFDWAEKASSSMPDDLALAKTLGILAYGQQQYDTSIFSLQRCAEKSGKDGEVDYFLGMDYYKLKRRNDSKLALKRALDLGLAENLASQAQATIRELK